MTISESTSSTPVGQPVRRGSPPARRGRRLRPERVAQYLFVTPAVVYVGLFFGYPVVKNAMMGSQDYTTRTFFTGQAPWVGWSNYATVLKSHLFPTAVLNTAIFTAASIAGQF